MRRIGTYEIVATLGSGGVGTVFQTLPPGTGTFVAVKQVGATGGTDDAATARFEAEVGRLKRMSPHPNLAVVRDAFSTRDGFFLATEWIDGTELAGEIPPNGLGPRRACEVLRQMVAAIDRLHRAGIHHGALQPRYFRCDSRGAVRLTDFGIAEKLGSARVRSEPFRYSPPETIPQTSLSAGHPAQVDVYALGLMAYELAFGENCIPDRFQAFFSEVLSRREDPWEHWHRSRAFPAPPPLELDRSVRGSFALILERMTAKDPRERYRDLAALVGDLAAAEKDMAQQTRSFVSVRRTVRVDSPGEVEIREPSRSRLVWMWARWKVIRDLLGSRTKQVWLACGGVAVGAVCLLLLLPDPRGFSILVKDVPRDAVLFVDGRRVGTPQPDGSILAAFLRAGERRISVVAGGDEWSTDLKAVDRREPYLVFPKFVRSRTARIDFDGPMALVPNDGPFLFGDDIHEDDAKPAHLVELGDYYIDIREVTNAQYKRFCDATGRQYPANPQWAATNLKTANYFLDHPDHPVVGVTWNDASAYAAWVGKRLPTEPEWEKAASWNPSTREKYQWPWGHEFDPLKANLNSGGTQPPGRFPAGASPYGVLDLAGNVAEWTADRYDGYPGSPVISPEFGTGKRVVRGGSFIAGSSPLKPFELARTTFRDAFAPEPREERKKDARRETFTSPLIGFRCAISADDPRLKTTGERGEAK